MKRIVTLIALLTLVITVNAQVPPNAWAHSIGNVGNQNSSNAKLVNDAIYITGSFQSATLDLDSSYTNAGSTDYFIAKYDTSGNILWSAVAGSSSAENGVSMAIDNSGGVYVAGQFGTQPLAIGGDTLYPSGSTHMFLAKYNSSGAIQWAKFGGTEVTAGDIAVDQHGNFFVTGSFTGAVNFGGTLLTSAGGVDMFVAKYDPIGNVVWAIASGGAANDIGSKILIDANANLYIAGTYASTSFNLGSTTVNNSGGTDTYIASLDSSGYTLWLTAPTGPGNETVGAISLDQNNNLIFTGANTATVSFGPSIISRGGFLAKYDQTGTVSWSADLGGAHGSGVFVNSIGNISLSGDFDTTITISSPSLTPSAGSDILLAGFTAAGNFAWATSFAGEANETDPVIMGDSDNNVYLEGNYKADSIYFGNISTNSDSGTTDLYLAKFIASCFPLSPVITVSGNLLNVTSPFATYQWYMNSTLIVGATGQIYTPTAQASYYVEVTDTNGCSGTSNVIVISGIESVNKSDLIIYPNPVENVLFIKQDQIIGSIQLYNEFGQIVYESNVEENSAQLDVSFLSKGIYMLKTSRGQMTSIIKN